jgi:hypothetical protein
MTQDTTQAVARPQLPLRELCRRIDIGMRAGSTMFDEPVIALVHELTGRSAEITELLDLLCELADYNTFDLTHVEVDDRYAEIKTKAQALAAANQPRALQLFADQAGRLVETAYPEADPVEFSPQGGGLVHRMSQLRFKDTFRPAQTPPIRKARFTADWLPADVAVEGFTNGMRWNGWGMPLFAFKEAQQLMPHMPGMRYDAARDAFIMKLADGEPSEEEIFCSRTIDVEGTILTVYPLGAGSWCWDAPE